MHKTDLPCGRPCGGRTGLETPLVGDPFVSLVLATTPLGSCGFLLYCISELWCHPAFQGSSLVCQLSLPPTCAQGGAGGCLLRKGPGLAPASGHTASFRILPEPPEQWRGWEGDSPGASAPTSYTLLDPWKAHPGQPRPGCLLIMDTACLSACLPTCHHCHLPPHLPSSKCGLLRELDLGALVRGSRHAWALGLSGGAELHFLKHTVF